MNGSTTNPAGILDFLVGARNNSTTIALHGSGDPAANNSATLVVDDGPSNSAPTLALDLGGSTGSNPSIVALGGGVENNDVVKFAHGHATKNSDDGGVVGGYGPCGACKFLRRKCLPSSYFDSGTGCGEFAAMHKIFGASNVSKLLLQIPKNKRRKSIYSMIYEAQARLKDPIYGCYGVIFGLQQEVIKLEAHISHVKAWLEAKRCPPPTPGLRAFSRCPDDLALTLSFPEAPRTAHGESFSRNQALHSLNHIGERKQAQTGGP